MPKCIQNHIKNVIDFWIDCGRVFAPKTNSKMEPKDDQTLGWYPFFRSPKRFENAASFFDRFGKLLGGICTPPGLLYSGFGGLFATPWQCLHHPGPILATSNPPERQKWAPKPAETKTRRETAANPQRISFWLSLAENEPRTSRESAEIRREPAENRLEPAENLPYEHWTKILLLF